MHDLSHAKDDDEYLHAYLIEVIVSDEASLVNATGDFLAFDALAMNQNIHLHTRF